MAQVNLRRVAGRHKLSPLFVCFASHHGSLRGHPSWWVCSSLIVAMPDPRNPLSPAELLRAELCAPRQFQKRPPGSVCIRRWLRQGQHHQHPSTTFPGPGSVCRPPFVEKKNGTGHVTGPGTRYPHPKEFKTTGTVLLRWMAAIAPRADPPRILPINGHRYDPAQCPTTAPPLHPLPSQHR